MRISWIAVPATIAVALVLTACGGNAGTTAASTASSGAVAAAAATGPVIAGPGSATVQRATSVLAGPLTVRRGPSAGAAVLTRLPATTNLGSVRVLLVRQVSAGWVKVSLPVRPNGSAGWVAAADVKLEAVHDRILVDVAARTLTLLVDGRQAVRATVGVGSTADPTPTGSFYVIDRVQSSDPRGAYGPFALGLSAHSTTLSEFGTGDGQVGIHGTNVPGSIGQAVSHGCVRVPNDVAKQLMDVPLGTPVVIS